MLDPGLRFDQPVAPNGYAWWYMDALSDDGEHGITVIAFIGSVFSPYYAWARRRTEVEPMNHCALNVALYRPSHGRWTMTERGRNQTHREQASLAIGPSHLRWTGSALEVSIDEICAPVPRRMRGTIRLFPSTLQQKSYALDAGGLHTWTPFAPAARIEVSMQDPAVNWSGVGYFDSNRGSTPLEDTFDDWTWSRANLADRTVILYDTQPRAAEARTLALEFRPGGAAAAFDPPGKVRLPHTRWGLDRSTRCDHNARLVKTLEDAPFYSRSQLDISLMGMYAPAIHESLSLDRFRSKWVQCLLPFRMPRIAH